MTDVAQVGRHTLSHPDLPISYEFITRGDVVCVVHICGRCRKEYTVPVVEARQLWRFLRQKEYEVI